MLILLYNHWRLASLLLLSLLLSYIVVVAFLLFSVWFCCFHQLLCCCCSCGHCILSYSFSCCCCCCCCNRPYCYHRRCCLLLVLLLLLQMFLANLSYDPQLARKRCYLSVPQFTEPFTSLRNIETVNGQRLNLPLRKPVWKNLGKRIINVDERKLVVWMWSPIACMQPARGPTDVVFDEIFLFYYHKYRSIIPRALVAQFRFLFLLR